MVVCVRRARRTAVNNGRIRQGNRGASCRIRRGGHLRRIVRRIDVRNRAVHPNRRHVARNGAGESKRARTYIGETPRSGDRERRRCRPGRHSAVRVDTPDRQLRGAAIAPRTTPPGHGRGRDRWLDGRERRFHFLLGLQRRGAKDSVEPPSHFSHVARGEVRPATTSDHRRPPYVIGPYVYQLVGPSASRSAA